MACMKLIICRCGSEITHKLCKKIKDVSEAPLNKHLIKGLPNTIDFNVIFYHLFM